MKGRFVWIMLVAALAGCGGGDGDEKPATPKEPPPASAQGRAVAAWASAAQAYWDDFRNCGSRAYPTRNFYFACTKRTRSDFRRADDRVLRALDRSKTAACKRARDRLRSVMARAGGAVEKTVIAFDRTNNETLKNRTYGGPSPQELFPRAAQAIEDDLPAARKISRQIDARC